MIAEINPKFVFTLMLFLAFVACAKKQTPPPLEPEAVVVDSIPDTCAIAILGENGKLIEDFLYPCDRMYDEWGYPLFLNTIRGYSDSCVAWGDFKGNGRLMKAEFKMYYKKIENLTDSSESYVPQDSSYVDFDSDKIEDIIFPKCRVGAIINEGDLNGDGRDELGVLIGGSGGATRAYEVFTLRKNKWKLLIEPIFTTLNMREAGIDLVSKSGKRGYVTVLQSLSEYDRDHSIAQFDSVYTLGMCSQYSNVIKRKIKILH